MIKEELKLGEYVYFELDSGNFIGPITRLAPNSVKVYGEYCLNQLEWDLNEHVILYSSIKRALPKIKTLHNQIEEYYPNLTI